MTDGGETPGTAPRLSVTGTPVADRRGQWSWALFDWANQPFFTLITTFIFAPYFASFVVGDAVRGQEYWGYGQAVAGFCIALGSPILGALADAGGPRKPWVFGFQAICVAACLLLWWAVPAASDSVVFYVLVAVVVASLAAEFSIVFVNAMLPGLTSEDRLGRLSGYAWSLGYVGGLVSLFAVLLLFSLPDEPAFGLDKTAHQHDRIVGPLTAVWMLIFIIPMALYTPDARPSGRPMGEVVRTGLGELWATLRQTMHYRNAMLFLLARMVYNDGLAAIFAFGGIYAAGIFGWTTINLGIFGIILTIMAAIGAFIGGWLDDRIGSKRAIQLAVAGLAIGTLGIVSISTEELGGGQRLDTMLFVIQDTVPAPEEGAMFTTMAEYIFLAFGILIGICGGPAQAASRTLVARLTPPELSGKFFGLYALSGKATAFVAPFAVAALTGLYNSQRAGLVVIIVFLVVGLLMLFPVREERTEAP